MRIECGRSLSGINCRSVKAIDTTNTWWFVFRFHQWNGSIDGERNCIVFIIWMENSEWQRCHFVVTSSIYRASTIQTARRYKSIKFISHTKSAKSKSARVWYYTLNIQMLMQLKWSKAMKLLAVQRMVWCSYESLYIPCIVRYNVKDYDCHWRMMTADDDWRLTFMKGTQCYTRNMHAIRGCSTFRQHNLWKKRRVRLRCWCRLFCMPRTRC